MEPRQVVPPGVEELQAYGLGKVNSQRATEIEAFLADGPDCGQIFEAATEDALVRHLRGARDLARVDAPPRGIPGYETLVELGRGGMGVVYKARHCQLNRLVAIKMVLTGSHAAPGDLIRFGQEAETVARLQHPNIVQIYEVGAHGGLPYLVLEYVEGGNLAQQTAGVPVAAHAAAGLVEVVARAVDYAHQNGVIHRDLKPANVLLTAAGVPKLTDFGLARRTGDGQGMTTTGVLLGTPGFMAPEQAGAPSMAYGPRTDIYGLGAILYHLLTGRAPVQAGTPADILRETLEAEPVRPALLQPRTPRDLETICLKCLEKEPAKRYPTALALAEDLRRFQAGEPIEARPVGRLEYSWRWCRRNKVVAALLAIVVMALLTGSAVATALALVAQRNARRADGVTKLALQLRDQARDERDRTAWTVYAGQIGLAQQAWRQSEGSRAWHFLNATSPGLRGWEYDYLLTSFDRDQITLRGHCGAVLSVAYGAGPGRFASAGEDRLIRLWIPGTGQLLRTLEGHAAAVTGLSYSPDGTRLASFSADQSVKVWDADTGLLLRTFEGHAGTVWSVAFNQDGTRAVSAGQDGAVYAWNLESGRADLSWKGHEGAIRGLAFSPDGKRLLTGGWDDGCLKLWDPATGASVRSVTIVDKAGVTAVAFSPDGRHYAGATRSRVKVWDANTHRESLVLESDSGAISCIAFRVVGKGQYTNLAIGNLEQDNVITIPDLASRTEFCLLPGHSAAIRCVAFNLNGQSLASASDDQTVKIWNLSGGAASRWGHTLVESPGNLVRTGPPLASLTLQGDVGAILRVAFSPDGRRIAASSQDSTVRVWNAVRGAGPKATGREVLSLKDGMEWNGMEWNGMEWNGMEWKRMESLKEHAGAVRGLAFSPDGRLIATSSEDKTVRVWNADSGKRVRLKEYARPIESLAFSPDSRQLAVGRDDGSAVVWAVDSEEAPIVLKGHDAAVRDVAFSPDGRRLASCGDDRSAKVWDLARREVAVSLGGHTDSVLSVVFSRDGKRLATASLDQTVRVWDAETGRARLTLKGHTGGVRSVAFSPDGTRVASGGDDRSVKMWETNKGQESLTLTGHTERVSSLAFSPDGKRLATAGLDRLVKVWDAGGPAATTPAGERIVRRSDQEKSRASTPKTRQQAPPGLRLTERPGGGVALAPFPASLVLRGHQFHINKVAFSPDGTRVASASADWTARVWNAATGAEILVFKAHKGPVRGLAFHPDGRFVVSSGVDKTMRVWNANTGASLSSNATIEEQLLSVANAGQSALTTSLAWGWWSLAFNADARQFALGATNASGAVWVLPLDSGEPPIRLQGHDAAVRDVAFSTDGRRLASCGDELAVKVWDLARRQQALSLAGHTDNVLSVVFSRDGKRLATAGLDQTVRVWDADTGRLQLTLKGHTGGVRSVAFSPDGTRIASGGDDRTVKVWDLDGGKKSLTLAGHTYAVFCVAFSPDGTRVASGSDDWTIRVWDVGRKPVSRE